MVTLSTGERMNLQDFIDLRSHCPMCGTALITKFISDRKQKSRLENDRYVAIMVMRGMRSCEPDYEAGYSFGMKDNSLSIEFYNEWDMSNHVSTYMIKIFRDFHKNMAASRLRFSRKCGFCFKYELRSQLVNIDLKKANYSSINLSSESFVFTIPAGEDKKFIRLDNHIEWNKSDMFWWRSDKDCKLDYRLDWSPQNNCSHRFSLPLIPFISKEETGKRLSNLITFS